MRLLARTLLFSTVHFRLVCESRLLLGSAFYVSIRYFKQVLATNRLTNKFQKFTKFHYFDIAQTTWSYTNYVIRDKSNLYTVKRVLTSKATNNLKLCVYLRHKQETLPSDINYRNTLCYRCTKLTRRELRTRPSPRTAFNFSVNFPKVGFTLTGWPTLSHRRQPKF